MASTEIRFQIPTPSRSSAIVAVKSFNSSLLRRSRGRDQAAAVCYRISDKGVEFLLVQTRNGCWTFPKGKVEPGLTPAQSAALEAFEEAGVHGRIEEVSFMKYSRRSGKGLSEILVSAHLCEVLRQVAPQESKRNPTWCSLEKSKRRLHDGRNPQTALGLFRVLETAVNRIESLRQSYSPDQFARIPYIAIETLKKR